MGLLTDRTDEIAAALLAHPHDHLPEPARSWLREQYRLVVPAVLGDALRAVETGEALPEDCRRRLRDLAARERGGDVPFTVALRGAGPALRVLADHLAARTGDDPGRWQLMQRACGVATDLGGAWVEGWAHPGPAIPGGPGAATTTTAGPVVVVAGPGTGDELDPVERRMLELVAHGRSNDEIARRTHYSRQAVGWHLSRLMRSWSSPNRAALVSSAFARGVLTTRAALAPRRGGPARRG